MSVVELRPRFRLRSDWTVADIHDRINDALNAQKEKRYEGFVEPTHLILRFPYIQRKLWSPQIDMTIKDEEDYTLIRGHIGPSPSVWTLFMFLYFALGMGFLFLLMLGYSQWSMDKSMWALYCSPACLLMMVVLYYGARAGQNRAKHQIDELKNFITNSLESNFSVIPRDEWD